MTPEEPLSFVQMAVVPDKAPGAIYVGQIGSHRRIYANWVGMDFLRHWPNDPEPTCY